MVPLKQDRGEVMGLIYIQEEHLGRDDVILLKMLCLVNHNTKPNQY